MSLSSSVSGYPWLKDRGSIEAILGVILLLTLRGGYPWLKDRGSIEARMKTGFCFLFGRVIRG